MGADANARDHGYPHYSVLESALIEKKWEAVQLLVAAGAAVNAVQGIRGPLHLAVGAPVEILDALLAAGADPRALDIEGQTPLAWAAGRHLQDTWPAIRALVAARLKSSPAGGAPQARPAKDPLPWCYVDDVEAVMALLEAGADMEERDSSGRTLLLRAATMNSGGIGFSHMHDMSSLWPHYGYV